MKNKQQLEKHLVNYTLLMRTHLVVAILIILGIIFVNDQFRKILSLVLAIIVVSLVVQAVVYRANPGLFNDKRTGHKEMDN